MISHPSVCPIGILTDSQGQACDTASIPFNPTIRWADKLVRSHNEWKPQFPTLYLSTWRHTCWTAIQTSHSCQKLMHYFRITF